MNKKFWNKIYDEGVVTIKPSRFARFCLPQIRGDAVELGCGNGRDVYYFHDNKVRIHGVDASNEDFLIMKQDVGAYMNQNPCPANVYTRFFWHAIEPDLQEKILDWTTGRLFIEARTTKDKPKNIVGKHKRYLVNEKKLLKQLKDKGFEVLSHESGTGFSPFAGEDPHLVRIVADRTK